MRAVHGGGREGGECMANIQHQFCEKSQRTRGVHGNCHFTLSQRLMGGIIEKEKKRERLTERKKERKSDGGINELNSKLIDTESILDFSSSKLCFFYLFCGKKIDKIYK